MIDEVNQAKLYKTYRLYKFLTVKNPSNNLTDCELLRVAHHLKNIIGFSTIQHYEFESGKQNQRHIHLIIKKEQMPDIKACSKKFKLQKLKYLEIVPADELSDKPNLIELEIDTKKCVWHLSEINNANHFKHLMTVYTRKEIVEAEELKTQYYAEDCDFIDSDPEDELQNYNYKLSLDSPCQSAP